MKNISKIMLGILGFGSLMISCESTELEELLDNPNALRPDAINLNDGVNQLQFSTNGMFRSVQGVSADLMRTSYMFGTTYQNATGPGSAGGAWTAAYATIFEDSKGIITQAETFDAAYQLGMTRVMRGYALMTLVDFWGDVPFTEANLGTENFNPALTAGEEVYTAALNELDLGIAQLARVIDPDETVGEFPGGDVPFNLLFDGNNVGTQIQVATEWLKFANSLKFKYYLNLGNRDEMINLINSGNLIDSNDENVAFRYSEATNPASRNPIYNAEYGDGTPGDYISNSFMSALLSPSAGTDPNAGLPGTSPYGLTDPRLEYYVYRQSTSFPSPTDIPSLGDALPCADDNSPYGPGVPFCATGEGYWGRDHGDADGIPPDNGTRSTYGVYPVGGLVDEGDGGGVSDGDGLNGAGITPILMAWQMDFLRAEAALRFNTGEDAKTLVMSGLSKSLDYVLNFDASATDPDTTAYMTAVEDRYDNATDKLQIVAEQLWTSSFQSAVESYNMYRRTGFPDNLQPHLQLGGAGAFPRSLFYLQNTANLNLSVDQKPDLNQSVFWADASIDLN